ncbi:restriction endonuclease subunit S [Pseudoglutamicibacter cumminsii]|uniref:restriction endonuclease subunit S n=1 Tax=Pseudoglutamicibacter cumminsii TaxID=156979 RepID=UPI0026ECD811|nr:restriction endonuclease subunit S [Pseudoglutamicibacter cumminsii]
MTWRRVALKDIGQIIGGGTPKTSISENFGDDYPWITPKDLSQQKSRYVLRGERGISAQGLSSSSAKLLPKGTVLLSSRAPIGLTAIAAQPVTTNQGCRSFVPGPEVDTLFMYYLLGSMTEEFKRNANGSTFKEISGSTLASIEVSIPSLREQRAIAATLGALDDKIESNRRSASLISELLDTHSQKFGPTLPRVPLGDIATPVKESLNPSNLGNTQVDHFSLPAFDRDARPERVAASSIMSNKLRVPKLAILLSRLNPRFNRTWWASADAEAPALASTEFLVFTSEDEHRLAAIWLALRDTYFRGEIPKRVTGTSGSHQRVKPADVLAIEVPDFTRAPTALKESALAMLQRSETLRVESARLSALRDALLPELLSGRIRVPFERS